MYKIDNSYLTLEKLYKIINEQESIELSNDATLKIKDCRSFLDQQSYNSTPIYGVNTGFGSLCNESISKENLE